MPKKTEVAAEKLWNGQPVRLAALIVVGSLFAYFIPSLSGSSHTVLSRVSSLSFQQVATLGWLTAFTLLYLTYYRAAFFFSQRWLVATLVYNFLILFVKFTLSTNEVVGQTSRSFGAILTTALLVGLLYTLIFSLLYAFFDGRILNKNLHKALITSRDGRILLAMALFVCATVARVLIFRLPVLSGTSASYYLGDIFKANTASLSALIFVMSIAAVEAFAQVRRRADLKYFYVSGVTLILTFHLWWAIFVYRGY